eukprot:10719849-Lingulodinium_polyedra.AAC.1
MTRHRIQTGTLAAEYTPRGASTGLAPEPKPPYTTRRPPAQKERRTSTGLAPEPRHATSLPPLPVGLVPRREGRRHGYQ